VYWLLIVLARARKSQHNGTHFSVPQMEVDMAKITDQFIRALQVPEGTKEVQAFDDALPGFGVRKQTSGHTTFFVKYTVGAQQRRKTLAPFVPGALAGIRKEAAVVLAQARLGKDVVGEARKAQQQAAKAKTLGELVPTYLELREMGNEFWKPLRPKSLREVTRYLTKSWQPLHGELIDQITRKMVRDRRDELVKESGAVSANRALAALSGFCGWAIDQEHISGTNPTSDIKPLHENDRERVLSEEELVEIWLAAGDDEFGRIVKLLMLTGQRCAEIGGLECTEIHVGKRQIELPGRRTKNKRPHIVPLSEPALALLGDMPAGHKFVFGPFVHWGRRKTDLDKRITKRRGAPLAPWVLHDLRRSFTTHIRENGFAVPYVAEAILNHVSGVKSGVAGTYDRSICLPERRDALKQWGAYLTGLVGGPLIVPQSANPEKPEEVSSQLISGTQ
jgi:integrase